MNVFDYIENYCKVHNIKYKSFKSKVLTKDDLASDQTFAPGVAFFYRQRVVGEITDITNLGKPLFIVNTPTDFIDFSKVVSVFDDGALQRAESDFLFVADSTMRVQLSEGANALFNSVNTVQLFYIYVSILPEPESEKSNENKRIYDITVNRTK